MKILVFYNPASGNKNNSTEEFKDQIINELNSDSKNNYEIVFIDILNETIDEDEIKKESTNIKALIISGGDGSISAFAKLAIENNIPLGILPSGTFNNFATDNGIPNDFKEALKIIKQFYTTKIDAAIVNDRYFVNNSSIGLYTTSVKIRERIRKEYGLNKFVSMLFAIVKTFYLFPMIYIEVDSQGKIIKKKTPFVFIGNNKYEFSLLRTGNRKSLNDGKLHVYYSTCKYRLCLLKITFQTILNTQNSAENIISKSVNEFTIYSKKKYLTVATDGEISKMSSPLKYQIKHNALLLIVPNK